MFALCLSEKVVWVSGGSRGIGRAMAVACAKAGARVAISYRTCRDEAEAVVKHIVEEGGQAIALACDVRDTEACHTAAAAIAAAWRGPDILINAAGVTKDGLFMTSTDEDWRDILDVNLMGAVHTTRAVLPHMVYQRYGRIINVSSVAGQKGGRGQSNYAASKGALEAMTRSLAVELGSRGINVNAIAPGVIETDMSREVIQLAGQEILQRQIIKRFGKVEEVAAWAVMLASPFGDFMTGQVLGIDGGLKML